MWLRTHRDFVEALRDPRLAQSHTPWCEEIGAHRGFSEVFPEADRKRRAQTRVGEFSSATYGEFSFGVDSGGGLRLLPVR